MYSTCRPVTKSMAPRRMRPPGPIASKEWAPPGTMPSEECGAPLKVLVPVSVRDKRPQLVQNNYNLPIASKEWAPPGTMPSEECGPPLKVLVPVSVRDKRPQLVQNNYNLCLELRTIQELRSCVSPFSRPCWLLVDTGCSRGSRTRCAV